MGGLRAIGIILYTFRLVDLIAHIRAYLDYLAAQVAMQDALLVEVADGVGDLLRHSENDVVW